MKHFVILIVIFLNSICAFSNEENSLIGTWELTDRVYKDYNGNAVFDNYYAYTQLKGDLYKKECTPVINSYLEQTLITFNEDNTGFFAVIQTINGENALLDWDNKVWELAEKPLTEFSFKYKYKYGENTINIDSNILKLSITSSEDKVMLNISKRVVKSLFTGQYRKNKIVHGAPK